MKRTSTAVWLEKYKRWQLNVQKEGKRRSFTSSTPGRNGQRECNAKADAWLDDNIEDANARVEKLFDAYLESLKQTTSKSNWSKIDTFGRVWILPAIGKKKISALNEQHLQDIINSGFAAGLSKKYLTNMRAAIVSFIKYCRRRKATTFVPEDICVPKGAPVGKRTILQPQGLATLFTCDTTVYRRKRVFDKYIYAYRFQVVTGLRPGELRHFQWCNIDRDMVHIEGSTNVYGENTTGKNDNAIRHFALSPIAKQVLEQQKALIGGEPAQTDLVFEETSLSNYENCWSRYCKCNGLPHITPYELRHTFVSIAKNLTEGQIKAIVGHSKNMDTFGVYGHEVNGELERTAQELNDLFLSILQPDKK